MRRVRACSCSRRARRRDVGREGAAAARSTPEQRQLRPAGEELRRRARAHGRGDRTVAAVGQGAFSSRPGAAGARACVGGRGGVQRGAQARAGEPRGQRKASGATELIPFVVLPCVLRGRLRDPPPRERHPAGPHAIG